MIPTVKEKQMKSLRQLTDEHQSKEVQKVGLDGLESIGRTHFSSKLKVWCYQHCLLSWLLRPLQVYVNTVSDTTVYQQVPVLSALELPLLLHGVTLYQCQKLAT